jgi:hypothetical protein
MSEPGFVTNGANGNTFLRWWPVLLFIIVQIAGASVIAYRVESLSCDVKEVKTTMVTSREWTIRQDQRDDQIGLLRSDVGEVKRRLETVEKAVK